MPIDNDSKLDTALDQIGAFPVVGWILYIPLMLITGPFRHSWKNALVGLVIIAAAGYLVYATDLGALFNAIIIAATAMIVGSIWYPGDDSYIDTLINGNK